MTELRGNDAEGILDLIESAISVAQVYGSDADREIVDVQTHSFETMTLVMSNGERWTVRVRKQNR